MHHISRHISYLLLSCRRVVVPGLGTFSASYERASFDIAEKLFYPSRIKINFTSQTKERDYMLEGSIKRKLKISDLEAEKMLMDFVDLINNKIEIHNYIHLDGIGELLKDETGRIYLKDTFGVNKNYNLFSAVNI